MINRSSWSILDFPKEEGEADYSIPVPAPPAAPRKLTAAERFALIRNRPNRKGSGARRRAGEKNWQKKK